MVTAHVIAAVLLEHALDECCQHMPHAFDLGDLHQILCAIACQSYQILVGEECEAGESFVAPRQGWRQS